MVKIVQPIDLRKEREKRGLSQAQLARNSGLSYGCICMIENGTRPNPTLATLKKISHALSEKKAA